MQAKSNDKVKIHYTLKTEGGELLESSVGAEPIVFTIGEGKLIPGFERGVIGMETGETKTITVQEKDGYGPREERKVFEFSRERAPQGFEPRIGQVVQMHAPDGTTFPVTVVGLTEKGFMMDANHPLAGKTLVFDIELVEIVQQSA